MTDWLDDILCNNPNQVFQTSCSEGAYTVSSQETTGM